jgi:hypothetical protein
MRCSRRHRPVILKLQGYVSKGDVAWSSGITEIDPGRRGTMYHTSHILSTHADSQLFVDLLVEGLTGAGLPVVQSFDFQLGKSLHSQCTCPHHGSQLCDCQMVMLLIYDLESQPVTLVVHGQDGKVHLGLVRNQERQSEEGIRNLVRSILSDYPSGSQAEQLCPDVT